MISTPPLSLYIHIPWCEKKCPYCDFNSHTRNNIPQADYVAALLDDLKQSLPEDNQRSLQSIFIGGGTPSLFDGKSYARLLNEIADMISFEPDIEITLEANPGSAEQKKFQDFIAAGINRLSIGIQSFNDAHLKQLGRIHNASEANNAITAAKKAGFKNINLDVMYGLPEQNKAQAMADLLTACHQDVAHVSWYQLTIEPNTHFYNAPPSLPRDETIYDMMTSGISLLKENGFNQYEISAYSRSSNQQSKHNLNYWQFGDYIGIGAGAHGKITSADKTIIQRDWKTRIPEHYLAVNKPFLAGSRRLDKQDRISEFMMNALRLKEGFPATLFSQQTGLPFSDIQNTITALQDEGLMTLANQQISTTHLGYEHLNSVIERFF